ncbi:MAG TPA: 30S ribosomal protein S15 [archaeon]|nr:30S ribosomal protein S15 [archaeon]
MARMYSRHKGSHGSKRFPIKRTPKWTKYTREDIIKIIIDLAKEKNSSAKIGAILRDTHGIPDAKVMIGRPISKIMKENDLYPKLPEDMMNLLRKAVELYDHLKRHRKDNHSLRSLQNLESKIRRLSKYYKREKVLPQNWKYVPEEAKLIVQK